MMPKFRYVFLAFLIAASPWAEAAEPPPLTLPNELAGLREQLGKPLLDTVVSYTNEKPWILGSFTAQGASFALTTSKIVGENFNALRQRSVFAVSFTTCSGSKSLEGKITSVIAWQALLPSDKADGSMNFQGQTASYVQSLLELMNSPRAITNPSTVRAPRDPKLKGVVFEYVKGDTTETFSLLDDTELNPAAALRLSWQAVNTSFCPKS